MLLLPLWVKPNRPTRKKKKRKPRSHGFARKLDPVTARLEHALQQCPQCQVALTGRRVIKTRRIIELPPVQAQVIEHLLIQRTCPQCQKRWAPPVDFAALPSADNASASACRQKWRSCASVPIAVPRHPRLPQAPLWVARQRRSIGGVGGGRGQARQSRR